MKASVLALLQSSPESFLSGEAMSRELGITRAAVWKQIKRLREHGYEIEAVTNLGYRLVHAPDMLELSKIQAFLGPHPWENSIHVLSSVDSTNNLAKREAASGAPHGSVYLADTQTGGRGRPGRSFSSPPGVGVYLSVLLRPALLPTQVGHVTAMVAVAGCNAVEAVTGLRPGIKWTNDLIIGEKKLSGILTEMSVEWESSSLETLVMGIGINCNQSDADFPEDVREKAVSLRQVLGKSIDRNRLAAALISELHRLSLDIIAEKPRWIAQYAKDCITIGRQVRIIRGENVRTATATGIDENGALLVRYENGETGVVFSGEVSVRGINGYI